MSEMKTEDIIKSLRICAQGNPDACAACVYYGIATCYEDLYEEAADMMELLNTFDKTQSAKLLGKINALEMENELLRGALASSGVQAPVADRPNHFADANKMVPNDERIMQQAIETYGVQAQCDVAIEEMAELTQVVMKIRRISDDYEETMAARDHLIDEIADVGIMIDQMEMMFGAVDVEKMRRKKLLRLKKRLELEGADEN